MIIKESFKDCKGKSYTGLTPKAEDIFKPSQREESLKTLTPQKNATEENTVLANHNSSVSRRP